MAVSCLTFTATHYEDVSTAGMRHTANVVRLLIYRMADSDLSIRCLLQAKRNHITVQYMMPPMDVEPGIT